MFISEKSKQVCYKLQADDVVVYIMPTAKVILQYHDGRCLLFHNFFKRHRRGFDNFVRNVLRRKRLDAREILRMAERAAVEHFDSEVSKRTVAELERRAAYEPIGLQHWADKRRKEDRNA